jgi:hypothetical protein
MELAELLKNGLQYDSSWAIYAYGTGPDSPARIGQTQFDNGGLLDGMEFVIDGVKLGDAVRRYTDGDDEMEYSGSELLDWLLEEGWIEYDNPECYAYDGCPKCGGCVYGAGFPNGDYKGVCLSCGWDDETEEWI